MCAIWPWCCCSRLSRSRLKKHWHYDAWRSKPLEVKTIRFSYPNSELHIASYNINGGHNIIGPQSIQQTERHLFILLLSYAIFKPMRSKMFRLARCEIQTVGLRLQWLFVRCINYCIQGLSFFFKKVNSGTLHAKTSLNFPVTWKFIQNFHATWKKINKIFTQNIGNSYQNLLSQIFYSLLHLSKVVVAICDLSTNMQM